MGNAREEVVSRCSVVSYAGQPDGFYEGKCFEVVEDGKGWPARLVCGASGWFFVSEGGRRSWPLISLWYWQALGHDAHQEGAVACGESGAVWLVGTAASDAAQQVEALMAESSMLLIDVRYAARSRWRPQWNRSALLARWGARYTHERGLGNRHYRDTEKAVELVKPEPAIAGAVELLVKGYSLLLLCGCDGTDTACHCRLVVSLIEAHMQQGRAASSPLAPLRRLIGWGRVVAVGGQASSGA